MSCGSARYNFRYSELARVLNYMRKLHCLFTTKTFSLSRNRAYNWVWPFYTIILFSLREGLPKTSSIWQMQCYASSTLVITLGSPQSVCGEATEVYFSAICNHHNAKVPEYFLVARWDISPIFLQFSTDAKSTMGEVSLNIATN